jgi:DNA-binding CsgD family transcriptional regulator
LADAFELALWVVDDGGAVRGRSRAARALDRRLEARAPRSVRVSATSEGSAASTASRPAFWETRFERRGRLELEGELDGASVRLYVATPTVDEFVRRGLRQLGLSPRLRDCAWAAVRGLSDGEIAGELDLQVSSARTYMSRMYRRLSLNGRHALTWKAIEHALLPITHHDG